MVAHVLSPQKGEFIIDTCSAPGGKTTHIATLMQNQGKIIAGDIYEHKLKLIQENSARLGIDIIETQLIDAQKIGDMYPEKADRVLVDAPCSVWGYFVENLILVGIKQKKFSSSYHHYN